MLISVHVLIMCMIIFTINFPITSAPGSCDDRPSAETTMPSTQTPLSGEYRCVWDYSDVL